MKQHEAWEKEAQRWMDSLDILGITILNTIVYHKIQEALSSRDDTSYAKGIIKGREQVRREIEKELKREF